MNAEPVADRATLIDPNYARIFVAPRATIREIVDRDPRDRVVAIVAVAGLLGAIAAAVQNRSPLAFTIDAQTVPMLPPAMMWKMQAAELIASPILAVVFLYIRGSILRWAGALFGGIADTVDVRAAIGWSSVPLILFAFIQIAVALMVSPTNIEIDSLHAVWAMLLSPQMVLTAVFWLYGFIIFVGCGAEVHRLSAWRAMGAIGVEQLLVFGIFGVLGIVVSFIGVLLLR